jgi:hypothetical protein
MQTNNIFEIASRAKLRFTSTRGLLTVEQLWDLPLLTQDGFCLDAVAREANKNLKSLTEESFVATERTPAHDKAEVTLEVVKHIIAVKIAEEAANKKRAENRVKKARLLEILAEKEDGKMSELSVKELQKQIAALDT